MQEWISVKDGLPDLRDAEYCGHIWRESEPVLAVCGRKYVIAKFSVRFPDRNDANARWETEHDIHANVTHWMPLPEMPDVQ